MTDRQVSCGFLAGGTGSRMQDFVRHWMNEARPKQFCRFNDNRTMLEATWDRALSLCPAETFHTIVTAGQEQYLTDVPCLGETIVQPYARGTACGTAYLLAHMLRRNPDALVVLLPADHFVYPSYNFKTYVEEAIALVRARPDKLVTLAAVPDRAEPEYGWISYGRNHSVNAFHEKPGELIAEHYFQRGYVWNTMITVGLGHTLWDLLARNVPEVTRLFVPIARNEVHPQAVASGFKTLEPQDFSRNVIENSVGDMLCLPMPDLHWSDWGRPERLMETVTALNINHHIPHDLAQRYTPAAYAS
ncbi:MAG: sugar phosphate nucleotidyltransferase [Pseudomonadota bacterium]